MKMIQILQIVDLRVWIQKDNEKSQAKVVKPHMKVVMPTSLLQRRRVKREELLIEVAMLMNSLQKKHVQQAVVAI
jgi:hypothetical protein